MMGLLLQGMHEQGSLVASVLSSSSNLIFSGIFGYLVFGEVLSLRWFLGATFLILGVVILAAPTEQIMQAVKPKKHEEKTV